MRPANCPVVDFDLWSDAVLADPYPTYRRVRDLGTVVWLAQQGVAALSRYDDVRAALTDWKTFSSAQGACIDPVRASRMAESILMSDPPIHTGYRKPLAEQLSVAALASDASAIMSVAVTHARPTGTQIPVQRLFSGQARR